MSRTRCLSETTLRLFNDGQLPDADIGLIGEHLEKCGRCLGKLESLDPGPLEQGMRDAVVESVRPEVDDNSQIDSNAEKILNTVFPETAGVPISHQGCELFRLESEIGVTSLGKIYLATDLVMERPVRIIIPNPGLVSSIDHRAQFIQDGNNASWMNHDNVLRVIQFGSWDESQCYLAMPHIRSVTLSRVVDNQVNLELSGVLKILGQICLALGYAHRHNIVHRHLSPATIHVDDGLHVWVAEFGLTFDGRYQFGLIEPLCEPTRYNSPESIRNEPQRISHCTDIFSMGAILDSLLDLAPSLDQENMKALRDIARKSQRNSRRKRFQSVEQVVDEIGQRVQVPQ